MDAAQALRELTEISSQIEAACLFDSDANLLGSTFAEEESARRFAEAAAALLQEAVRRQSGDKELVQLEAALLDGSVFVVLEGHLAVAAVTKPEPTVGLVFYDLKSCLRAAATPGEGDGRPRPRARETVNESAA
jgi:predicted regulator of Ras-like GTPase activity (Roadblock/LC7/MglB family)